MLQLINPRSLELSHAGGSGQGDNILTNWENPRPIIKELQQTVNFAERRYGDLIQELNLCKEYYEKRSTERITSTISHKRSGRKRFNGSVDSANSSGDEHFQTSTINDIFGERIRNKIFEITKEIKETNRKIITREESLSGCNKNGLGCEPEPEMLNHATKSEPIIKDGHQSEVKVSSMERKQPKNKKRPSASFKRPRIQKFKLRSKSLPQGVKRKFGFGSFVEIVEDHQLKKAKSRSSVSSGSKSNLKSCRERMKSWSVDKLKIQDKKKGSTWMSGKPETSANVHAPPKGSRVQSFNPSETSTQNIRSCSNISSYSSQAKPSYVSEVIDSSLTAKKSLALAPRQPIPFTICRTSKTFNLGLNIQQVLSLIKSKRHSAMLQSILKDNIPSTSSVTQKAESNLDALFATSSTRLGRTEEPEGCPVRIDTHRCLSTVSSTRESESKCKMISCRHSMPEVEPITTCENHSPRPQMEIQRPEDVWVVEQPDPNHVLQRYRSRCTCYPTRQSTDYQKVLKKYLKMKECEDEGNFHQGSVCSAPFSTGFVMTNLCPMVFPNQSNHSISKMEFQGIREDLDNLFRRYEHVEERLTENCGKELEADAELNAFELELTSREEGWKTIVNHYNRLMDLKRKVSDLRERMKSSGNAAELNAKGTSRLKKDPFRPTPSMTLTRVLRQIQCLQDKIRLIDSPPIS